MLTGLRSGSGYRRGAWGPARCGGPWWSGAAGERVPLLAGWRGGGSGQGRSGSGTAGASCGRRPRGSAPPTRLLRSVSATSARWRSALLHSVLSPGMGVRVTMPGPGQVAQDAQHHPGAAAPGFQALGRCSGAATLRTCIEMWLPGSSPTSDPGCGEGPAGGADVGLADRARRARLLRARLRHRSRRRVRFDSREALPRIRVPVLLINGDRTATPPEPWSSAPRS